jgi:hypothetical protein
LMGRLSAIRRRCRLNGLYIPVTAR